MDGLVNPGSFSPTVSSKTYSTFDNFNRSINHDPTLFTTFKDKELWDNCNYNTVATACTQGVEDVLHEAYVTSTPDGMAQLRGITWSDRSEERRTK